jgi:co-chaperonin GroES (HSP10)
MSFAKNQNVIDATVEPLTDIQKAFKEAESFDPSYDRILVKREKSAVERKLQKSGLITADAVKDAYKSSEGFLIKCGPTADEEAVRLIGKRILFAKYSGEDIIVPQPDGSKAEFVLATDSDIFGELK